jgi:hypothetical protein
VVTHSRKLRARRRERRAFSLSELCCSLAIVAVVLSIALPALARTGKSSMLTTSFGNLMDLGVAHVLYANEWNGRQVQIIVEDISTYGDSSAEAFSIYNLQFPFLQGHPPVGLGWGTLEPSGTDQIYFAYRVGSNPGNNALAMPMGFGPLLFHRYYGSFRLPNALPFHDYVGGRFYDPTFYAPGDGPVWDAVADNGCFASADEYADCFPPVPSLGDVPGWSSYCLSPAALYHPNVMRNPADGGWQFPWSIDEAFETPGLFQARHPSLKTFMLEHNWIQNAPKDVCNPNFPVSVYDGCEPYYFNHSIDSAPATLFYDISVRLLPNTEAKAADQQVLKQTGAGLWSRDTEFGVFGYLIDLGFDGSPLSHHILTTDGMLGRDTVAGE